MASTIIFGLFFSTVTALTVVPALYGLLFDRGGRKRVARGFAAAGEAQA
jgi:multidrug efflux pump subunit AcrB